MGVAEMQVDHICVAKARPALKARIAWGEPHKRAIPAIGMQKTEGEAGKHDARQGDFN